MNRQENATELIFKWFSKDELDKLKRNDLVALLSFIGLENYLSRFPEARSYSYEIVKNKVNEIKKEIDEQNNKYLFEQYADENGLIDKNNCRELFINHITSFTPEQIESLLDDIFKQKKLVEFNDLQNIHIF